jgi:hypothetical protein
MFTHVPTYGVFQAGQTYKPAHFSETKVRLSNSDVARRALANIVGPLETSTSMCVLFLFLFKKMENCNGNFIFNYIILYLSY